MTEEPESENDRIRSELLSSRVSVRPLQIYFHHVIDDDTLEYHVWTRLVRMDGTEAFAVISVDDAETIAAFRPKVAKFMTRIVTPEEAKRRTMAQVLADDRYLRN